MTNYANVCKDVDGFDAPSVGRGGFFHHLMAESLAGVHTVQMWRARWQQRLDLAALPEHLKRDVGLSDAEIRAEVRKPFWVE